MCLFLIYFLRILLIGKGKNINNLFIFRIILSNDMQLSVLCKFLIK